jgi:hypothetical protein
VSAVAEKAFTYNQFILGFAQIRIDVGQIDRNIRTPANQPHDL